jgi:NAD(P)-dependent dehydrogenase (short-subunit alcohol dehydrogenase family)
MTSHPALATGNVAVITGGADGIGLATARKLQDMGLSVCIADIDGEQLELAAEVLGDALALQVDVSQREQVEQLREAVLDRHGRVDVLMNNAGTGLPTGSWKDYGNWRSTLEVNLWGVLNGVHSFVPGMLEQGSPGLVVNTGSKQGITNPPGNPAYNVSKAAIRSLTESLQHEFRNTEGCRLSAHLLVPGFTYTGMIRRFVAEQPPAAWSPEQVAEFLVAALERGDFYVLCPDNDVDRETDNRRMAWAMGDLVENRSALSRWDPAYQSAFDEFMEK